MVIRITFLLFLLLFSASSFAFLELKSNFYGSLLVFGRSDVILSTHNTLLFGGEKFKVGGFYSYEKFQKNTTDTSAGGALRFGEATYLELQVGAYERKFKAHTTMTGKGVMGSLIVGKHFGSIFGFSLMVMGKKITSGMDKRLIVKVLPYFGLRVGF